MTTGYEGRPVAGQEGRMTAEPVGMVSRFSTRLGSWAIRVGFGRKLAIGLACAALASGLATAAALTGSSGFGPDPRTIKILLILDLVLFLLLGAIVARRLVQIWMERRRGSAGSRLHTRFVLLFSLVAVTPAIIVSVFSVVFFDFGIQGWFSERVRNALKESLAVAEAYMDEHQQLIRGDILAMARDLNRAAPLLVENPQRFQRLVNTQARIRSLNQATVFDSSGRVLARWDLSIGLTSNTVPGWAIERARQGETVLLTSESDDQLRAMVKLDRLVDGYLYVTRFVDPRVLLHIERNKRAVASYEQAEDQRWSFEITFSMIFLIGMLLLLMAAIWVGLTFATRLVQPVSDLVSAAEQVRAGDLTARVTEGSEGDEIALLSRAFNRMAEQLGTQRDRLIDANRQLDERRNFIETVLSGVTSGVIGLDENGRLKVSNRTASELLADDLDERLGETLETVIPEISELLARVRKTPGRLLEAQVETRRASQPRTLLVRIARDDDDDRIHGFVVTFDDITELLSAQRKAAWSDVARRIAHEIKNPLTPIQLAAERLRRKYADEISSDRETFTACTDTIIRQVADIGQLVDEFSAFARMPAPTMKAENLRKICRQAMFLHSNAHRHIEFVSEFPEQRVEIGCDSRQVGQALTNLLQNAVDSIDGRRETDDGNLPRGRIVVAIKTDEQHVNIEVSDNGRGFPRDERNRLTEPYVTTREKGTGLGLAIVKKIMEDHGGEVVFEDLVQGGALVRLSFAAEVTDGGEAEPEKATVGAAADGV